jgi:hypothetical protein
VTMNRYAPHVYIIPEDDCDRQLANGFVLHDQVKSPRVQVREPAGGWREVIKIFEAEYIHLLHADRKDQEGYVVMLIDFDGYYDDRRKEFEDAIPSDLKQRVFVVGSKLTPEDLKKQLGKNYEQIGLLLADDCFGGTLTTWNHDHLKHNDPDRLRLVNIVKSILFGA